MTKYFLPFAGLVFINLPKQIPANLTLANLIQQAPESFNNRCGKSFLLMQSAMVVSF